MKPSVSSGFLGLLFGIIGLGGCGQSSDDAIVVAGPWTANERSSIEQDLRREGFEIPIVWVGIGVDRATLQSIPRLGVDLILGLSAEDCDRLASTECLRPFRPNDARPWRIARRSAIGVASVEPDAAQSLSNRSLAGSVAIDDPRRDPITLAWAQTRLASSFSKGYAELVRTAANAQRIGIGGSVLGAVVGGRAKVGPVTGVAGAIDERTVFVPADPQSEWIEGVALVRGGKHETAARALLEFLASRGQAEPVPDSFPRSNLGASDLLADLLGATLVDAQDELWEAAEALDSPHPPELDGFLGDAPPWPPTSVAKLRARPQSDELLSTLAREITPDSFDQSWLVDSWDRPGRPIDAEWLREVADVGGGSLVRQPRFRMWLRGEWTAWARQHYRRIAREAGKVAL